MVKKNADSDVPSTSDEMNINIVPIYSAFVWAVHKTSSLGKPVWAVLAPRDLKNDLKQKWEVDGKHLMGRVTENEKIHICVPLSESKHLPLTDNTLW